MAADKILSALREFGLSGKEAEVWLACLGQGASTAYGLANKVNLSRPLVYDILRRLLNAGLVSYSEKNKTKYFMCVDPAHLLKILGEKMQKVKDILPELKSLHERKETKTRVETYVGKEGMARILNDVLDSGVKEILRYGSSRITPDFLSFFAKKWNHERIRKGIKARYIYPDTPLARKKVIGSARDLKLVEYKFVLSDSEIEAPTAVIIYGNKVVLASVAGEPLAVLMENKEFAENQKKYFEHLWNK